MSSLNHACKIVIRKWDIVTCGMLSVKGSMRCSTPRGSSPPKRNLFGGMEEIKKGKMGKRMKEEGEPAVL